RYRLAPAQLNEFLDGAVRTLALFLDAARPSKSFLLEGQAMSTTAEIIIALIAGGFIGAAVLYLLQQGRTRRLRERFGPEYNPAVSQAGSKRAAAPQPAN